MLSRRAFKTVKFGAALVEIEKERNTGNIASPGPWGIINSSLEINSLSD